MSRWFFLSMTLLLTLTALMFFIANRTVTKLDLFFAEVSMPVGILVPLSVFVGFLIAGVVLFASVIIPQRLRLRQLTRAQAQPNPKPVSSA